MSTLRQLAVRTGNSDDLRRRLEARAKADIQGGGVDTNPSKAAYLETKKKQLVLDIETAERRMTVERDDKRYEAIAKQFDALHRELLETEAELEAIHQYTVPTRSIDEDVEVAMSLFNDIIGLNTDDAARGTLVDLPNRLGLRIGLTFTAGIKGKKRQVRRLVGGIMAFGNRELPVPLFGSSRVDCPPSAGVSGQADEQTTDRCCYAQDGVVTVSGEEVSETAPPGLLGQQEGVSYTKVSRGDRRWTFLNDSVGTRLLWSAIAQTWEFTADTFYALGG